MIEVVPIVCRTIGQKVITEMGTGTGHPHDLQLEVVIGCQGVHLLQHDLQQVVEIGYPVEILLQLAHQQHLPIVHQQVLLHLPVNPHPHVPLHQTILPDLLHMEEAVQ